MQVGDVVGERFEIRGLLGVGGMGIVHRAYDRELGAEVALKTLAALDTEGVDRLKREFRALADLTHPNLVVLYELVGSERAWFFSMELVDGVPFVEHARGRAMPEGGEVTTEQEVAPPSDERTVMLERPRARRWRAPPPGTVERLRPALRQLCEGVHALHAAGKVHCDVKPDNALVTPEGRVVLLDLGLARSLMPDPAAAPEGPLAGTPGFMAPEQGSPGATVGPATDWYAVGAVLFAALTGRAPFTGEPEQVLEDKRRFPAARPSDRVTGVPSDLDDLCAELLRIDPAARPSGAEVLRRLGGERVAVGLEGAAATRLVGRAREVACLEEALAEADATGRPVVVHVRGEAGCGKTALVERFLQARAVGDERLVLVARCHEHESVPFKAVDGALDALGRRLRALAPLEAQAVAPRDPASLARVFPALSFDAGVRVAGAPRAPAVADPREVRRLGFAALRELLGRLSRGPATVLFLDGLQWGDLDSVALLEDVLTGAGAPAVLLIAGYRDVDAAHPFVRALRATFPQGTPRVHDLSLGPLDPADAEELALTLLAGAPAAADPTALAREAGGNPRLVEELARFAREPAPEGAAPRGSEAVSIDGLLAARLDALAPPAARLLEVLAVAGRPLPERVALEVASIPEDVRTSLVWLRHARLAEAVAGQAAVRRIQIVPGPLGAIVRAPLGAERTLAIHRDLAAALARAPEPDHEAIASHLEAIGERGRAAEHARLAAAQAERALSFARAARLHELALTWDPAAATTSSRVALAEALANAGRGAQSAEAYLAAAEAATSDAEAVDLERRAGEQLLRAGHVERGLACMERVLAVVGYSLAPDPWRAVVSLLSRRAALWLRGTRFVLVPPERRDPRVALRTDACWAVSTGLAMVDHVRGADFQSRYVLGALALGDPVRIARGLALEASFVATAGVRSRRRALRLLDRARGLATRIDEPHALGLTWLSGGIVDFLAGRWSSALRQLELAESVFRQRCVGAWWEITTAERFVLEALFYLGELERLRERVEAAVREARERGDVYTATLLPLGTPTHAWLALDEAEAARAVVDEAMERWPAGGSHIEHFYARLARANIDLYEPGRDPDWGAAVASWRAVKRAQLHRIQSLRVHALESRARVALACACRGGPDREHRLRAATLAAHRLGLQRMRWSSLLAMLASGGIAAERGRVEAATERFGAASLGFEAEEMPLHAAVARRRLGELEGGEGGRARVAEADRALGALGVRDPARMAEMLAPGRRAAPRGG